ncbi:MDR family MFS transporter [Streptomyces sp. CA-111067]|uniref:MDR family MFS transporter n=1 Tax=Streptomyces sp. CA-111067 TaxID=3240046 RepID=UPI003D99C965
MAALTRAVRETVEGLPRQFWWLWTSTLVNRLGGFVVTFLALYLTVQRGYSASYAGLVAALFGLGGAAGAVLGGVLADRIGRRRTMLAAQVGAAASTAVLGLVAQPAAIAGCAALVGLTSNASRPALQAMMADLVPREDRARAFALNYWAINIGFGVSAAAAGFIAAEGYLWLFLGDAATTLLCALLVYAKARETLVPAAGPDPAAGARPMPAADAEAGAEAGATVATRAGAKAAAKTGAKVAAKTSGRAIRTGGRAAAPVGLGHVLRDRRFMALVGLTLLLGVVTTQGSSTLAIDMGDAGLSARQYGTVIALNGLAIVLLQIPVTRLLRSRPSGPLLAAGSAILAWGFGLTYFAGSVSWYALTVLVWTLGEIVHAPASMAVVVDLAPSTARGRYQGMYSLSWSAASFAGPLAGGLALDHLGRGALWAGCALVGTVAGAGYYVLLRTGPGAEARRSEAVRLEAPAQGPAERGAAVAAEGSAAGVVESLAGVPVAGPAEGPAGAPVAAPAEGPVAAPIGGPVEDPAGGPGAAPVAAQAPGDPSSGNSSRSTL